MLTPRQVSERLSVREFFQLAQAIDIIYGKKDAPSVQTGSGWGGNEFRVAGMQHGVPFQIVSVERMGRARLTVIFVVKEQTVSLYWDNLIEMPSKTAAGTVTRSQVAS